MVGGQGAVFIAYILGGTAAVAALMRFMRIRAAPGTPVGNGRKSASVTYT